MPRRHTYTTASVLGTLGKPELRQDARYGGYLARCVIGFWSLLDDATRAEIAGATAQLAESTNQLGTVEAFVIVNRAIARAAREDHDGRGT